MGGGRGEGESRGGDRREEEEGGEGHTDGGGGERGTRRWTDGGEEEGERGIEKREGREDKRELSLTHRYTIISW